MELFHSGVLIKELRKQKKWTQSYLCEGICDKGTLARIEKGERRPEMFIFISLMERLGEDPRKYYYDIITMEDKLLIDLDIKLTDLLRKRDKDAEDEAELLINELDERKDFKSKRYMQLLLHHKATLSFNREQYTDAYNYAIQALKITNPNFDEEKIDTYIYTSIEMELINTIAAAHNFKNSIEKSTDIYLKLKTAMDKNYMNDDSKLRNYLQVLFNVTKNLSISSKHEDCLQLCDKGIELSKADRNSYFLPRFIFHKGCSLLYLNKREEGIGYMCKAYALFLGMDNHTEISLMLPFLENEFGLNLSDLEFRLRIPPNHGLVLPTS